MSEDRSTVVNYLRLRELPNKVKALVADGQLSMGHARAILGVPQADNREALARSAVANNLSVRALEQIIRRRKESGGAESTRGQATVESDAEPVAKSAQVRDLENRFQQALGTKVRIVPGRGRQRGRIVIDYFSFDDFDRIPRSTRSGSRLMPKPAAGETISAKVNRVGQRRIDGTDTV
jgi:ParB family chromosome partitioning protein